MYTVDEPGAPTMHEAALAREADARQAAWDHPLVQAARAAFPEAELDDFPGKRRQA